MEAPGHQMPTPAALGASSLSCRRFGQSLANNAPSALDEEIPWKSMTGKGVRLLYMAKLRVSKFVRAYNAYNDYARWIERNKRVLNWLKADGPPDKPIGTQNQWREFKSIRRRLQRDFGVLKEFYIALDSEAASIYGTLAALPQ